MFDALFGAEMPLAVRFFLAFLIVLGLIGAAAWAVRRFGAGRLGATTRGRQPRLAVIDHASVDGRRRLILVRRDNVEHLLMIGGPTDVVVEPNIVRAVAAPRDVPAVRPTAGIDALPRAIPLPENGAGGSWPLQPEPAGGLRPSPRLEQPLSDELPPRPFQPLAETPTRPQRDTLAALADELSARPAPPRGRPAARPQPDELSQEIRPETRQELRPEMRPGIRQETHEESWQETRQETRHETPHEPQPEHHREPRHEPRPESRHEPRAEPRHEPRGELRLEPRKIAQPSPAAAAPAISTAAPPPAAAETAADQSLTDMAQRLEAALRKPHAATDVRPPANPGRTAPPPEQAAPTDAAPPAPLRAARPTEPKPARTEAKTNQSKTLYDSLEQEMASLLGRQNKT